jgi:hypothetical protein
MVSWIKVLLDTGVDPDTAPDMDIHVDYRSIIIADSPSAYWRLGESVGTDAFDEMGFNSGVYINAPTLGNAPLIANDADTCVSFDRASNQYVEVLDHATFDFGSGPFSYECWFATPTTTSTLTMIGKGTGALMVQINALVVGQVTTNVKGSSYNSDSGATNYADALPHHLVVTHDEFAVEHIWIDMVDVTVQTNHSVTSNSGANMNIGRDSGVGNAYDGPLDEVAVYRYVLTADRIAAHYRAGT